jgi:ornithine--oxo-acid transaminase
VEPIQSEAGVVIPLDGYLPRVREICIERSVPLIADEIQSGLGRTGTTFACELEGVRPDVFVLGKAFGGGIAPVSAVVADRDVLGVFEPGQHGSTLGGNPVASTIGRRVVAMFRSGELQDRSAKFGEYLPQEIRGAELETVAEVRGRGLGIGIDLVPVAGTTRASAERLLREGVLAKDTHE